MATTTPFLDERGLTVWNTDARRLPDLVAADSVDALVTDPPYELALGSTGVSARWDSTGIAFDPAFWASLLPVMKPGAFAFVFGSPRTWHRLACAMEDAGWRLRDQIAWLYSSGMPKGEWGDHAVDRTLGHRDGRVSRARCCDTFSRARVERARPVLQERAAERVGAGPLGDEDGLPGGFERRIPPRPCAR